MSFTSVAQEQTDIRPQKVLKRIPVNINGITEILSLPEAIQHFKVPIVSLAVIEKGQIKWVYTTGFIDSKQTKPANSDTLFQAASISKPITAMTALTLVDKKKLNLDASVNPLLKEAQIDLPRIYVSPMNFR